MFSLYAVLPYTLAFLIITVIISDADAEDSPHVTDDIVASESGEDRRSPASSGRYRVNVTKLLYPCHARHRGGGEGAGVRIKHTILARGVGIRQEMCAPGGGEFNICHTTA